MCGICGRFNYKTGKPAVEGEMLEMARTIAHRGPDDEGSLVDGPLGFGFRRLSIIDIEGGHQPMRGADGSTWLVFNGEIYNFKELRKELSGKGHSFSTRSDTEVILRAYAEWGIECLERLDGMFGLAIWDGAARRLVVARDRFGIKGVYFADDEDGIVFGSEMRAVLRGLAARPGVDPGAMRLFLKYRYFPAPTTPLAGVRKLAAGTCLVVDAAGERLVRWYAGPPRTGDERDAAGAGLRIEEAEEELARLYRKAVKSQLVSDVPVGLLLSGGVDSALLLALMSREGQGWNTYTVGFGDGYADDELGFARASAAAFCSKHESVLLSRPDFEAALPRVVSCLEEPVATASIVPMFAVCAKAREGVKVALVGQGPDEIWGGYARHLGLRYSAAWRALPSGLRGAAGALATRLSPSETIRRGLAALGEVKRSLRYEKAFSLATEEESSALFREDAGGGDPTEAMLSLWTDLDPWISGLDEVGAFQFLETRFSLPDELLMYTDKMSMAHSIELRVPYLDKAVVEFSESLPDSLKIRRGKRKYLHKRVAARMLPKEIVNRKKRAFSSNVVDSWFRDSADGRFAEELDDPEARIYAFLDRRAVGVLLAEHRNGRRDNHKLLFSVLVLEEWLRAREGATT